MISCKIAAKLMSEAMDRELTFSEKASLKFHLAMCKTCRFYENQINKLRTLLGQNEQHIDLCEPPDDEKLSSESCQRMKDAIQKNKNE